MIDVPIRRPGGKALRFLLLIAASISLVAVTETANAQTRSFDGTSNNTTNKFWGAAGSSYDRMGPAAYDNGMSTPRSGSNARDLSNVLGAQSPAVSSRNLSSFVWQWGQFLDHDIALTGTHATEMHSITVSNSSDPLYPLIPMRRSDFASTGDKTPRQQINSNTSYIDASMIYGSSQDRADALRTFSGGQLKMSAGGLLPRNTALYDNANDGAEPDSNLFLSGDIRANEQPGLTAMHTVFAREHNRLAEEIADNNSHWDDEQIYQHARRIVGGIVQSITYNEYLPTLLGSSAPSISSATYDANTNATLSNEFATAAFRLGHTQVTSTLMRIDNNGQAASGGHVALSDAFFSPSLISSSEEIDYFVNGLAHQVQQETDLMIVDDLRNMLFGSPGAGGMDLFALNVQRGRDHGLATFCDIADRFGVEVPSTFAELTSDVQLQQNLASVYADVGDVDLWIGLLAEDRLPGLEVGNLMGLLLQDEFTNLMTGDRFFFAWDEGLTEAEIDLIMNTRLSDILQRNTSLTNLSDNVFLAVPEPSGAMILIALGLTILCGRRRSVAGCQRVG